jgi:crotonobetainyl-CoA:carnitine CoA-transferase CaiB-like acyl-CoA transferase
MPPHALDGVRVIDLSRVLAGPLCCMMLPFGAVNSLPEVFSDPQVAFRGLVVETPHRGLPSAGVVRTIRPGATLRDTPAEVRLPPPMLGQHTAEVLSELGLA